MSKQKFPRDFIRQLKAVKKKRPRTVIEHILEHGFITTEELRTKYGYNHPPRAARDVREEGIPLETFRVRDSEGRSIGAYRFADLGKVRFGTLAGRKVFSKSFKKQVINALGCKCTICLQPYEDRYLQVDHRIPYEVIGDVETKGRQVADYMLLCGSCNRAKSWSCEHCVNWLEYRKPEVCKVCYWATPEVYEHVALQGIRRLDVVWAGEEIKVYEALKQRALMLQIDMPDYVKVALKRHIENDRSTR
jgi:hypothetical protein